MNVFFSIGRSQKSVCLFFSWKEKFTPHVSYILKLHFSPCDGAFGEYRVLEKNRLLSQVPPEISRFHFFIISSGKRWPLRMILRLLSLFFSPLFAPSSYFVFLLLLLFTYFLVGQELEETRFFFVFFSFLDSCQLLRFFFFLTNCINSRFSDMAFEKKHTLLSKQCEFQLCFGGYVPIYFHGQ